jgi:Cu/Ag efflux pump CusA
MEGELQKYFNMLQNVKGITDLGIMHNIGQPELDINLDQGKMGLYGVAAAQANAVISMAIGGLGPGGVPASTLYEGIKTFDIRGRDMGRTIAEAQQKCDAAVHLKRGYSLEFQGDFENQRRAQKRLA